MKICRHFLTVMLFQTHLFRGKQNKTKKDVRQDVSDWQPQSPFTYIAYFPYNASEWWLTLSVCLTVYGNGIMLNKWQKSELSLSGTNILPDGESVESVTWDYSGHILRGKHRGYRGCAELNRTTKCSHWAEKHSLKCLPKHLCTQMQYVHT